MKKPAHYFSVLSALCFSGLSLVGGVAFNWRIATGGLDEDFAYDANPTSDGGYIAAGVALDNNYLDILVVKTDAVGTTQWRRSLDLISYSERAFRVEETNDGGFIVIGSAYAPNALENRPWLIKLDAAGQTVWSTENGLTQTLAVDSGIVVGAERSDGSFVIAGGSNSLTSVQEPWSALVDANGQLISYQQYASLVAGFGAATYINDLTVLPDDGFVLTGYAGSGIGQAFLWAFDANGVSAWSQLYPLTQGGIRAGHALQADDDGGFLIAGRGGASGGDALLAKTDAAGALLWSRTYPDQLGEYTAAYDVFRRADGGLLLLQQRFSAFGSRRLASDFLELDAAGSFIQRTEAPGGDFSTALQRLTPANDGMGFIAAGNRRNEGDPQGMDFYLLRGSFDNAVTNQSPFSQPESYTVNEDQVLTVDEPGVLANDGDPDGDPLAALLVRQPRNGFVFLEQDGAFTYTPRIGFAGVDRFLYRAADGQAASPDTEVVITVNEALNHPPTAGDDYYQTGFNDTLVVLRPGVLINDEDVDGDALSAILVDDVQNGNLNLNANGLFVYVPDRGFSGTDGFTYRASDGQLQSDPATVTIVVRQNIDFGVDWRARVGDAGAEYANDGRPTSDGGAIGVGVATENNLEGILVVKTNARGDLQWQRQLDLSLNADRGFSVAETQDGGFIVIGSAYVPDTFGFRPWLIKLDAQGDTVWSTENGLTQSLDVDAGVTLGLELPGGGFVAVGGANTMTNPQAPWVATTDADGRLLSFQTYDNLVSGFGEGTYINHIEPTPDGGFILTGTAGPFPGRAFLWKFGPDAQPQWSRLYTEFQTGNRVRPANGGGYWIAGCGSVNCSDALLARTDSGGQLQWSRTYPAEDQYGESRDVAQRPDGKLVLLRNRFDAFGTQRFDSDLLELDSAGNPETTTELIGGSAATRLTRLETDATRSSFVLSGYVNDSGGVGDLDFYLVKGALGGANPSACPDFTGDGQVGSADLRVAAGHWSRDAASPGWNAVFDLDGDGSVNLLDLVHVARGGCD